MKEPNIKTTSVTALPRGLQWISRLPSMPVALVDQAVVSGANFLHMIAAAKCLSMEDFGVFSLAWVVLIFAGNLHQALVLQPLAVLYSEYSADGAKFYLRILRKFHIFSLSIIVPIVMVSIAFPSLCVVVLSTAVTALIRQAVEYERRVAYVIQDSARALIIDFVTYIPVALIAVWLWWKPQMFHPGAFLILPALPALFGLFVGRWLLGKEAGEFVIPANKPTILKDHWLFGKWILLSTLAVYAGTQLYPFLIAGIIGLREVAVLYAARSILGVSNIAMAGIEAKLVPKARFVFLRGGWAALRVELNRAIVIFITTLSPLLIALYLFPEDIMVFLMGSQYGDQGDIVRLFCLLYLVLIANRVLFLGVQAVKKPQSTAIANVAISLITIAFGPYLVNLGGLTAAVIAMIFNASILFVVQAIVIRNIKIHDDELNHRK